jgi:Lrp/AsnC family transcriptional regulator for asnA, asnC and gidA
MEKIDSLDRQILEIISQNARIPFKDVAAECGVSRAAIHQRVQRLIDLGVIIGSGYHVNPKSLGYRTCTYVGIKLEKGSMYKAVVNELKKIPEIVECHFTTGAYTMLTKVYSRDNEHLMDILNSRIQEIPGVTATETMISLEQYADEIRTDEIGDVICVLKDFHTVTAVSDGMTYVNLSGNNGMAD